MRSSNWLCCTPRLERDRGSESQGAKIDELGWHPKVYANTLPSSSCTGELRKAEVQDYEGMARECPKSVVQYH